MSTNPTSDRHGPAEVEARGHQRQATRQNSQTKPPKHDGRHSPAAARPDDLLAATGATPFVTAAGTLVPFQRSKGVYVPLLCDLGTTSVAAAVKNATTFVTKLGLYPGRAEELFETYAKIEAWSAEHGVNRLADLVDDHAAGLITEVAGVSTLSPQAAITGNTVRVGQGRINEALASAARQRRQLYYVHNALVSLRSATVLTRTRSRKQRVVQDSLAYGLPALLSLEDRKGRPLTDEEILLGRFLVEIDRAEKALPRPLIGYLFGECAIRPIESTALDTTDLDDRNSPTTVTAPGVWEFGKREVSLTAYAAATLPLLLNQLRSGEQPLSYDGAAPGSNASHASLSDVLKRHLRRAGITDPEVTAKSLNLWRVQHTLVGTRDMAQARKHHGGRTRNLLEDLKLDANENDIANGVVHLQRRDTDELLVTVDAEGFYDKSSTDKGDWRDDADW